MRFGLTEHQHAVVTRALVLEESRRTHLVVAVSGAHAYGFPSPDSDVDVKAIHIHPTRLLLGLRPAVLHADRLETVDGVEVDYSSNELGGVLTGLLGGNGNYLERILGGFTWSRHAWLGELVPLARASLSRRVHRHYHGFSGGQLLALEEAPVKTVKKVLYVLRTALTGLHVLRTGDVVPDLTLLMERYGFGDAAILVQRKRAGERTPMEDSEYASWRTRLIEARAALDDAVQNSVLPQEPPNEAALEAWLLEVRKRAWDL